MMKHLLSLILLLQLAAFAAPTQIRDTVYTSFPGVLFSGRITVSSPTIAIAADDPARDKTTVGKVGPLPEWIKEHTAARSVKPLVKLPIAVPRFGIKPNFQGDTPLIYIIEPLAQCPETCTLCHVAHYDMYWYVNGQRYGCTTIPINY